MQATSIGRTLRWARKRAAMTQHDVARAVGMPQSTVARIERASVLPRMATAMAILEATGHELRVEPRVAVRPELRAAARERLSRSIPQRVWDASGRNPPTAILRALRVAGVPFVLVGDLAEVAQGAPRALGREVEICHASDSGTLERLARVLREPGADAAALRPLSTTAAGDDYDRLIRTASRLIVDTSLIVPVAALEDLLRIRRARREDAEVEILVAVEQELSAGAAG